jgi:hypothetical protein
MALPQVGRTAIFVAAGLDPDRESIESCLAVRPNCTRENIKNDVSIIIYLYFVFFEN